MIELKVSSRQCSSVILKSNSRKDTLLETSAFNRSILLPHAANSRTIISMGLFGLWGKPAPKVKC